MHDCGKEEAPLARPPEATVGTPTSFADAQSTGWGGFEMLLPQRKSLGFFWSENLDQIFPLRRGFPNG